LDYSVCIFSLRNDVLLFENNKYKMKFKKWKFQHVYYYYNNKIIIRFLLLCTLYITRGLIIICSLYFLLLFFFCVVVVFNQYEKKKILYPRKLNFFLRLGSNLCVSQIARNLNERTKFKYFEQIFDKIKYKE
jgi:hypothetical protein